MQFRIISTGNVILADHAFVSEHYANDFEEVIETPVVAVSTYCTKRAFQNRFPLAPNGISTKWDIMSLFLSSDSYATAIGVTGVAMHGLRLLIQTGLNRMDASMYVDLAPGKEASQFTLLLTQPGIPAEFALTSTERTKMLTDPLLTSETYKG